jgi:hypothetical protein
MAVRGGRCFGAWSKGVRQRGSRGVQREQSGVASLGGCRGKRRDGVSHVPTAREVTHGAAAACVLCGADVVAGRQHWRKVAAEATQLSRARDASVRAPLKRRLRLTSGPRRFFI